MNRLSNFLNLSYDPAIFNYHESEESRNTSSAGKMWENVAKPILANNSKKYLQELTKEEIVIFESVAGEALELLGYELEFSDLSKNLQFSNEDISRFDKENQILKEQSLEDEYQYKEYAQFLRAHFLSYSEQDFSQHLALMSDQ